MRLSGWHVPIERLSASSLSLLITCPEQFRLRQIKKIPETFGVDRFMGIVDHSTHAHNFKQKIASGKDFDATIMEVLYQSTWDDTISDEGEPVWYDSVPEKTNAQGLRMIQTYHELISPTVNPIKVEERFEEMIPGVPIPIVGYPDIEEKDKIIERKTSKNKVSKPKPKWLLQGRIYGMVLDKDVEWHISTKQVTPQVVTPMTEPTLHLDKPDRDGTVRIIQQSAELLNDLYSRYGPDNPWPTNGIFHDWMCSYCSWGPKYAATCVAWKES